MNIIGLREKWNKEKDAYKTQEVGSGVQMFVKEALQSEDMFNLKKGLKSTPFENRENEFLEEEITRERRQADVVIYISPNIVIPVEIERYQNIDAGTEQIIKYKTDLEKPYGILTDGFTWRFYTNNIYREFTLNQMLDDPGLFLEFWSEYIKPESYYLLFFEPFGQLQIIKQETLPVESNRELFFEDVTKLIKSFKNKLQLEGYLNSVSDNNVKEKMAVELTYAYVIQFVLYKTLVDNEFESFKEEFDSIVEKIHEHLKDHQFKLILGLINNISAQISENIYQPFKEEQEYINQKLLKIYRAIEDKLSDVSPWLDIFVFIKKYSFANIENEIFGYIYENYLKELYAEGKKGQYFTDPAIVTFMLQQIGFTPDEIKKKYESDENSISLIDPACGSGTFLYSAVDHIEKGIGKESKKKNNEIENVINNNVFGLDIEEFPIYLAEMNIVMRMLPRILNEKYNNPLDKKIKVFLTKDSIAEFMDTGLKNTAHDEQVEEGQMSMDFNVLDLGYTSYVRKESDLEEMKKSLESHAHIPRRRFDYVIGNPPYVGYNESSKQGLLSFELMKQGKAKLNNIYGVNLHSTPEHQKKYAPKPNLYAFFIALGIALLKDNGKLCYIIPQTILTANDLDVVRYHLAKYTTVEKIITFSGKMFIGRGLKQNKPVFTSSLIFVISRKMPTEQHQVAIINHNDPNDYLEEFLEDIISCENPEKVSKKKIEQNKLLQNYNNWNFIKQNKEYIDFYEEYQRQTRDISIYYEHILAENKFGSRFYFDKGLVFPKSAIKENSEVIQNDYYALIDTEKNTYTLNESALVVAKSDISIPHGSQGFNVYAKKYKIIWSYMNYDRFRFTDKKVMISFNYVIISSDNKREMLYLLSILNSSVIRLVIEINLRTESEKDILIGIKSIKEYVRIPEIAEDSHCVKNEIIERTDEMLALEKIKLKDIVEFPTIMVQRLDEVSVEGDCLVLRKDELTSKLRIKKSRELVIKALHEKYHERFIGLAKTQISLNELKELPIIDHEKQRELKDYIDDLVFALYFNIMLDSLGLENANKIKARCSQNQFYRIARSQAL